jgi:hypothetical protein
LPSTTVPFEPQRNRVASLVRHIVRERGDDLDVLDLVHMIIGKSMSATRVVPDRESQHLDDVIARMEGFLNDIFALIETEPWNE